MTVADEATSPRRQGEGTHTTTIVTAARRLVERNGGTFTTQDLIKEAGVALQTFYRHFESKDQLLLAVITDLVAENCDLFAEQAAVLDDPLERLHAYVTTTMAGLSSQVDVPVARFVTSEHWRLQQLFPREMVAATKPFADLVEAELDAAEDAGMISSSDHERDARLITTLVMGVYHEYSFLPDDPRISSVGEELWEFCLAAVGGGAPAPRRRRRPRGKR